MVARKTETMKIFILLTLFGGTGMIQNVINEQTLWNYS